MKVWVTKFALTKGILELEVDQSESYPNIVTTREVWKRNFHGKGVDWHLSEEEAKIKAEDMRLSKVKSLQKSLAKFEKMRFT